MSERHPAAAAPPAPLLNLPLVLEADYLGWLAEHQRDIDSLHFALPLAFRLDHRVQRQTGTAAALCAALARLSGPRRYALLNCAWHPPELLQDSPDSRELIALLRRLRDESGLDGIVCGNGYLLQHLADTAPDLAASLEAVPGVNLRLDSLARIRALLDAIDQTGFHPPSLIVLDRELNRNLPRLAKVADDCRAALPGLRLELLANEGCLPHCLFKAAHDSRIDLHHAAGETEGQLNRTLGCLRAFDRSPWLLLASPWIRPEDQAVYLSHVDGFKLCGRTLGGVFLRRVAAAWLAGGYAGNLLDLLDTPAELAHSLLLDHRALPADFLAHSGTCHHDCRRCGYCPALFRRITRPLPLQLLDFRKQGTGTRLQGTQQ